MAVNLSSLAGAGQQFFDNDGVPLAGGVLFSFEAGSTTPQTTFTSADGVTQHANPIILDSAGRVPGGQIWLSAGLNYKFVLETSDSVLLATWDNITGINGTGITSDASNVNYLPAGAGAVTTTVQTKLRESVTLEDFGASPSSSPTQNATAFIKAVQSGKRIAPPQQAYSFLFDGNPITYTEETLDLDLGLFNHTFLNFGGIVANNTRVLRYNGRFTANDGYCKGLGRFRNLQLVDIDTIEITDVYCDNPTSDTQFFGLEYSSNNLDDNQLTFSISNAVFKNIITETQPFPNAIPMTGIGNFGSSSTQTQQHLLNINNLYVENFYSVSANGVTVIDGDSDFFRFFTNPTRLTINNCVVKNIAKRFVKTQEQAEIVVNNLKASTDSRFTNTSLIGFFEGQATPQTAAPTRFTILHGDVDFASQANFFNASGADHEMFVQNLTYRNITVFSSTQNILFDAENITGESLLVLANSSTRINIKNIVDSALEGVVSSKNIVDGFTFSPKIKTSSFPITNAILRNGNFTNVDVNSRVAQVREITNVTLTYTTGTSARRPIQPVSSGVIRVNGLTVNSIGPSTETFDSPGGGGTMIIRDYRSTNQTLAAFNSGTWNFVLDNCDDDTVIGVGAVSVVRATYV
jgi:hypothetical protein